VVCVDVDLAMGSVSKMLVAEAGVKGQKLSQCTGSLSDKDLLYLGGSWRSNILCPAQLESHQVGALPVICAGDFPDAGLVRRA
jgi:hypothetical protein